MAVSARERARGGALTGPHQHGHVDAKLDDLRRHGDGQLGEERLGGAVHRRQRAWGEHGGGGGEDDAAAEPLLAHALDEVVGEHSAAGGVAAQVAELHWHGGAVEQAGLDVPGVGEDHLHGNVVSHVADGLEVHLLVGGGEVHGHKAELDARELLGEVHLGGLEQPVAVGGNDHVEALRGKALGDGLSDAAAATSHKRPLCVVLLPEVLCAEGKGREPRQKVRAEARAGEDDGKHHAHERGADDGVLPRAREDLLQEPCCSLHASRGDRRVPGGGGGSGGRRRCWMSATRALSKAARKELFRRLLRR